MHKYNLVVSPGSTKKNKTGGWRIFKPVFDHEKCIGCGACERFCPEGVCFAVSPQGKCDTPLTPLKKGDMLHSTSPSTSSRQHGGQVEREYYECDLDYCKGCGICAKECPAKAIEMAREEK